MLHLELALAFTFSLTGAWSSLLNHNDYTFFFNVCYRSPALLSRTFRTFLNFEKRARGAILACGAVFLVTRAKKWIGPQILDVPEKGKWKKSKSSKHAKTDQFRAAGAQGRSQARIPEKTGIDQVQKVLSRVFSTKVQKLPFLSKIFKFFTKNHRYSKVEKHDIFGNFQEKVVCKSCATMHKNVFFCFSRVWTFHDGSINLGPRAAYLMTHRSAPERGGIEVRSECIASTQTTKYFGRLHPIWALFVSPGFEVAFSKTRLLSYVIFKICEIFRIENIEKTGCAKHACEVCTKVARGCTKDFKRFQVVSDGSRRWSKHTSGRPVMKSSDQPRKKLKSSGCATCFHTLSHALSHELHTSFTPREHPVKTRKTPKMAVFAVLAFLGKTQKSPVTFLSVKNHEWKKLKKYLVFEFSKIRDFSGRSFRACKNG